MSGNQNLRRALRWAMRSITRGRDPDRYRDGPESVSNTLQSRDRKPAFALVLFPWRMLIFSHPPKRHIKLFPKDLAAGQTT